MCVKVRDIGDMMAAVMMFAVFSVAAHGDVYVPPGRVGVHWGPGTQFTLLANNAELRSWEFISPTGVLIPDPDGDASPWEGYLSNSPTWVYAASDPSNAVLVDEFLTLDVGTTWFGQYDFWYTAVDGTRVPGPIFPLSGVQPDNFQLVADERDGSLTIVRGPSDPFSEGNWTYSYSIESLSASLVSDSDGDAEPYLTYLSNSETLVSAATSNAVVIHDSLVLDATLTGTKRDLVFHYEILGNEWESPYWLRSVQGTVTYIPEPHTFVLWSVGTVGLLWRKRI